MSIDLKAALKSSFKACHDLYHQKLEQAHADAVVKSVGAAKGRLARSIVKQCDDYASEVLGRKCYSPWLRAYSAVHGQFREGWVPQNYYETIVSEQICGPYLSVAGLKPLNSMIFASDSFPDLISYANGSFFDRGYKIVAPDQVAHVLFREHEKVVFKTDNSLQGLGVFVFTRASFDLERVRELGNGLFQGFIVQHEQLESLGSKAVATLRLTTYLDEQGAAAPRACYLRLGGAGDTHVRSDGQIRVPISLRDGRFSEWGYTPDWLEIDAHPASGERFSGKAVPSFQACADLVSDLHRKAPFVRCVGWDVAVEASGRPRIMEWNIGCNGIEFTEATQGPCFADLHWERYRPTGPDRAAMLF